MNLRSAAASLACSFVVLGSVMLAGCGSHEEECKEICRSFITTCEWNAWSHVSQCTQGCVEDMYRRDDADEVFDCYRTAIAAPRRAAAQVTVQRALDAGLFAKAQDLNEFNIEEAIDKAIAHGTCDPFAAVQCKVQALKQPPTGIFIRP